MPRTKLNKKNVIDKKREDRIKEIKEEFIATWEMEKQRLLFDFRQKLDAYYSTTFGKYYNKTLHEAENDVTINGSLQNASTLSSLLSTTRTGRSRRVLSTRKSDDDGYLTADYESSERSRSVQRSTVKSNKPKRLSRSLSRSSKATNFKTPLHKTNPSTYGLITPKVKPNTPQVLLRQPKHGEVALSLQGSPLFTGTTMTQSIANVNIPLSNGTVLSLQPERGLRPSAVPELDPEIKMQLKMLRDNLNKLM